MGITNITNMEVHTLVHRVVPVGAIGTTGLRYIVIPVNKENYRTNLKRSVQDNLPYPIAIGIVVLDIHMVKGIILIIKELILKAVNF